MRTVRHLRPSQLWWRMRYRVRRGGAARATAPPAAIELRSDVPAVPVAGRGYDVVGEELVALLERGEFVHLNHRKTLTRERPSDGVDWRLGPQNVDRLWTVTLHYHGWAWELARVAVGGGDLGARAAALLRRYLGDWIEHCPLHAPGSRDLAWNSYAIATRIGWWVRLHQLLQITGCDALGDLRPAFLRSLWMQAAYLHENLEWDLRANHLMRDAVGLAWAGRFFEGDQSRQWLVTATDLALEQVDEQVLADGGHFERSPMYHLHVMEDLLTLASLLPDNASRGRLRKTWTRMAEFARWMRHPDRQIPQFNDAALNGAVEPDAMLGHGRDVGVNVDVALPRGGRHFEDTGLITWHDSRWSVFFDVGRVGPDYQPGHAHADTLSIECSFNGKRLFIDPGVHGYDHTDQRRRQRSTAAHNTVCIDDEDSSEVWHIFRVGRRAYPRNVSVALSGQGFRAEAEHDGYERLRDRPVHRRRIELKDDALTIIDSVSGAAPEGHVVGGGYLLHPDWHAEPTEHGWTLRCGATPARVTLHVDTDMQMTVEDAEWSPEFGLTLPTCRLAWRCRTEVPLELTTVIRPC